MDLKIGDRVKYTFPNAGVLNKKYVIGSIELIDDFSVTIRTDDNIKLKVNFKNLSNLELLNVDNPKDQLEEVI